MKINPDGTFETTTPEEFQMILDRMPQLGQSPVETASDVDDEVTQLVAQTVAAEVSVPMMAMSPREDVASQQIAEEVHANVAVLDNNHPPYHVPSDMPVVCARGVQILPEHRRSFQLFLPVTQYEADAINIIRNTPEGKFREWTAREVLAKYQSTDPAACNRVMAALSAMERSGRGVIKGHNYTHYLLDEFGRSAVLVICGKPSHKWPAMRQAAIEARSWVRPSS